jgi:hypothetical protein
MINKLIYAILLLCIPIVSYAQIPTETRFSGLTEYKFQNGVWGGDEADATYDGIEMIYIDYSTPTTNYSAAADSLVYAGDDGTGQFYILFRVDISDIPNDFFVRRARLLIVAGTGHTIGIAQTGSICVYVSHKNWVETQATFNIYSTGNNWSGHPSGPGDVVATWDNVFGRVAATEFRTGWNTYNSAWTSRGEVGGIPLGFGADSLDIAHADYNTDADRLEYPTDCTPIRPRREGTGGSDTRSWMYLDMTNIVKIWLGDAKDGGTIANNGAILQLDAEYLSAPDQIEFINEKASRAAQRPVLIVEGFPLSGPENPGTGTGKASGGLKSGGVK